jgi:tetratricopeptide (TPR) repeat protein
MSVEKLEEIFADQEDEPIAATPTMMLTTPLEAPAADEPEQPIAAKSEAAVGAQSESAAASESAREPKIVAIVAERPARQPRSTGGPDARKEYIRKSDWLRAQFLPEVQALDFSGLFVGNLGMGVREQQARRRVVLADPARITDVLLRGNSFRRTGDHAKALICYQELVDMDPGNADFRFLLGKTLLELGQHNQGIDALNRAKELGHEGARKELDTVKPVVQRQRRPLGFLRFWKQ